MVDISTGCATRLRRLLNQADAVDVREGNQAYARYNQMLVRISDHYELPLARVAAAFVALSPNSDYFGNLRSLVSVLAGVNAGLTPDDVTVSTYGHCKNRAWTYATGEVDFLATVKGPKIRSFYQNILDPEDPHPVTIDGHMVAAWLNQPLTMRQALIKPKDYPIVAEGVRDIARERGAKAHQIQAVIWFTRKRLLKIVYNPQQDLFGWADGDAWRTLRDMSEIRPYR